MSADVKQPQDHKPKKKTAKKAATAPTAQHAEATDAPMSIDFDGDVWEFRPSDFNDLEFLATIEDADTNEDVGGLIRAMRMLLGNEQASRFFKGRRVEHIQDFFAAIDDQVSAGNS